MSNEAVNNGGEYKLTSYGGDVFLDAQDNSFGLWSSWSSCSKNCGTGRRTRRRNCPSGSCGGESSQTEKCHERYCVQWTGLLISFLNVNNFKF